jgi:uncharacterized iron-regulated membrane protein
MERRETHSTPKLVKDETNVPVLDSRQLFRDSRVVQIEQGSAGESRWRQVAGRCRCGRAAGRPAHGAVEERVTLGKLMLDLHTGKAFFGKEAEWIWIDLLGGVWVFLGFTGIYLWWRTQTKRRMRP